MSPRLVAHASKRLVRRPALPSRYTPNSRCGEERRPHYRGEGGGAGCLTGLGGKAVI